MTRYTVSHWHGNVDLSPRNEDPRQTRWLWWAAQAMRRRMNRTVRPTDAFRVHRISDGYMIWTAGEQVELRRVQP